MDKIVKKTGLFSLVHTFIRRDDSIDSEIFLIGSYDRLKKEAKNIQAELSHRTSTAVSQLDIKPVTSFYKKTISLTRSQCIHCHSTFLSTDQAIVFNESCCCEDCLHQHKQDLDMYLSWKEEFSCIELFAPFDGVEILKDTNQGRLCIIGDD